MKKVTSSLLVFSVILSLFFFKIACHKKFLNSLLIKNVYAQIFFILKTVEKSFKKF